MSTVMSFQDLETRIRIYSRALKARCDVIVLFKRLHVLEVPVELLDKYNIFGIVEEYCQMPEYQEMARRLLTKLRSTQEDVEEDAKSRKRSHESTINPLNTSAPAMRAKKPESSGPRGSVSSFNRPKEMLIGKTTVVSIEKFQKTTPLSAKDQLLKIQLDLLCTNLAKSIQLRETFQGIDVLNPPYHMLHQARILAIPLLSQPIDSQVKKMAMELIEKVEQKKTTHSRFLPNPHSFFIKIAQDIMDHPENADQIKEKYQMDMLKREQLSKRWDGKTRISFDDEEPMAKRSRNRNY